jgi:hypothetical protein
MEPWLITSIIILLWEFFKFIGIIIIPESIKHYFQIRTENLRYSIYNRVDYKEITKTILTQNLTRAIDNQLELYRNIYEIHFKTLYIDGDLRKRDAPQEVIDEEFGQLFTEILDVRKRIFYNMIYAPEYFTFLLHAEIGLHEYTAYKHHKFQDPGLSDANYKSYDHIEELDKAAKWLIEKMGINIDLEKIENYRKQNSDSVLSGAKESMKLERT